MPRKNQPGCPCGCSDSQTCVQTLCVQSCLNLTVAQSPVTISVYKSVGGTLLASGTLGASGCLTLAWTGASGNYFVVVTVDGDPCSAKTVGFTCGGTTQLAVSADCLCFGADRPPASLNATWVWYYGQPGNYMGPFTLDFTFAAVVAGGDYYTGGGFQAPFQFNFALAFAACQLIFMPAGNINCGVYAIIPPSTCSPLNLLFTIPPTNCSAFGELPPTIKGALTVTG